MAENLDILNTAVSLLIRAALLAAIVLGTSASAMAQTLGQPGCRCQSQGNLLPQRPRLPTRNAGLNPSEAARQERHEATI